MERAGRPLIARLIAVAASVIAVAVFGLITLVVVNRMRMPVVPLPDDAMNVHSYFGLLSFYKETSFVVDQEYLSLRVAEYYDQWAERHGWQRVSASEEHWSSDGWVSYIDETHGTPIFVDEYFAHWADEGRRWSLRLTLKYQRTDRQSPGGPQLVVLWIERFNLIPKPKTVPGLGTTGARSVVP